MFATEFHAPILMHPAEQSEEAPMKLSVELGEPMNNSILHHADISVIHIPGHSPGSIMLYLLDDGGILLAGDSAVGPGPEQNDQTPRLQRTVGADQVDRFLMIWQDIVGNNRRCRSTIAR